VSIGAESVLVMEGALSRTVDPAEDPLGPLVHRVRGGEVEAFEGLMALTEQRLLALAWRMLGDRDLARDAAQETYLRIFRSLDTFRSGECFEPWMVRIAVHVCYDLARKRGPLPLPEAAIEALATLPTTLEAEEAVLLRQRRGLIRQALAHLPQAERTALILRDLQGFATEEVARILGVRPVTIRSQVASARAKVKAICDHLLHPNAGGPP
jgi:RNA polymerase sigma-70 factor (ECF subfamily)